MAETYVMHGALRSSAAYRVRIALQLKGLAFNEIFLDLAKGDHDAGNYRAINPQGLVPALVAPDGTVVTQSLAILDYLEDMHPAEPLLPPDPAGRARVRSLAQIIACDIHPINNMRVRNHIRDLFPGDDGAQGRWMARWSRAGFDALEARLTRETGTGMFCHGDRPGYADACLVPQVYNAGLTGFDLASYPQVRAIANACASLPEFRAAHPDNQTLN
jgi:maleylpyruvate isomerase